MYNTVATNFEESITEGQFQYPIVYAIEIMFRLRYCNVRALLKVMDKAIES